MGFSTEVFLLSLILRPNHSPSGKDGDNVVKKAKTRAGTCRLCGATGPLCLSHLIPRRVFEVILSADPAKRRPS